MNSSTENHTTISYAFDNIIDVNTHVPEGIKPFETWWQDATRKKRKQIDAWLNREEMKYARNILRFYPREKNANEQDFFLTFGRYITSNPEHYLDATECTFEIFSNFRGEHLDTLMWELVKGSSTYLTKASQLSFPHLNNLEDLEFWTLMNRYFIHLSTGIFIKTPNISFMMVFLYHPNVTRATKQKLVQLYLIYVYGEVETPLGITIQHIQLLIDTAYRYGTPITYQLASRIKKEYPEEYEHMTVDMVRELLSYEDQH